MNLSPTELLGILIIVALVAAFIAYQGAEA
jgi:hypothetical protein